MDLRARIGRLLVVGIPGPELDAATREALEQLAVGGVVLFGRNVESPRQIRELTRGLHRLASRPLVSIDQEGGRVARLQAPFTRLPPAAAIGRAADTRLAHRIGTIIGRELASVGIDIDYAPVLDVDSNPENPVIGDRAFSPDAGEVSRLGVAMMNGLRAGGVIPCGKHFPGHGGTATDSHRELPCVRRSRAELEQVELAPFRAAVKAGIPMLMTAHVLYPALDRRRPATLSPRIVTSLLRRQMGFRGVVASDDLHMGAIAASWPIARAGVEALAAGVDWLLVCHDLNEAARLADGIAAAVRSGEVPRRALADAWRRIGALMRHHARRRRPTCRLPNSTHQRAVRDLLR